MMMRIGIGYDVHPFQADRPLYLGGVLIPEAAGLKGHSDADVLLHAIIDALLGAAALGDIGSHFPDTDPAYKNADSKKLLQEVVQLLREKQFTIGNVDVTVVAEKPRLSDYKETIRLSVAQLLECSSDAVSIKATTSEKMGFVGRAEGIAVHAVALIRPTGKAE
ncbi:MAG: 2-C-methyl-D-erythritol 2,4-cyclodiphosphate synthase [Balneolaceae bacterium]